MSDSKGTAPALIHSTASKAEDHPRHDADRDLPMSVPGEFRVAVVGDVVMTRPISRLQDDDVQEAIAPIASADLAVGNLEQTVAAWREFEGHHYGVNAFLVMADPSIAADLAEIGFDILSRANNRLSDFGDEGNRETDAHLRAAGITPVGYGEHLAAARAPAYRDTPKGRVGAIGVTSHTNHGMDAVFGPAARVGLSNGRPGANNLRVGRTITLPRASFERLKAFVLEHDYAFPGPFVIQPTVMVFEDRLRLGNEWYVPGDEPGYSYRVQPDDLRDVLKHTRNAAAFSNFTLVSIHSHQWTIDPRDPKGGIAGEKPHPPDFLVDLAHRAIDEGADLFCVHGPFDFRAIEVYAGKPIFYGLGSFVRQPYMQEVVPWETYRRFEFGDQGFDAVDPNATSTPDVELLLTRTPRHPAFYFEGATAVCTFQDSRLTGIELQPVDLGIDGPLSDLGVPRRASPEQGERILGRIAENSAPFGTTIEREGGSGVVKIG